MYRNIFRYDRKAEKSGFAYESDGALVIDVAEETDKEIPPCIIVNLMALRSQHHHWLPWQAHGTFYARTILSM